MAIIISFAAAAGVVLSWQQQQWLSSSAWVGKQISTQQGFRCQVYGFYFSCYIDATASSIIQSLVACFVRSIE